MKQFLMFLGVVLIIVPMTAFFTDYGMTAVQQQIVKRDADEAASGAVMYLDSDAYSNGSLEFNDSEVLQYLDETLKCYVYTAYIYDEKDTLRIYENNCPGNNAVLVQKKGVNFNNGKYSFEDKLGYVSEIVDPCIIIILEKEGKPYRTGGDNENTNFIVRSSMSVVDTRNLGSKTNADLKIKAKTKNNTKIKTYESINAVRTSGIAYSGVPKVTLELEGLDTSGKLIYCGIDFAVFWDSDKDGKFTVVPDDKKIKRFLTSNTNITVDMGKSTDYTKGIEHKLAMRTLYIPVGGLQDSMIIADYNNGNEGWVEIPGSLFTPTYFVENGQSSIKHTEKWEQNRNLYNRNKADFDTERLRGYNVFWSGEKFIIKVKTNEKVQKILVKIKNKFSTSGKEYQDVLTNYVPTTDEEGEEKDGGTYSGEIWAEDMINRWGNYAPYKLDFVIQVIGNSDKSDKKEIVLEEKEESIIIDNRELFYRNYRKY